LEGEANRKEIRGEKDLKSFLWVEGIAPVFQPLGSIYSTMQKKTEGDFLPLENH
jgi:hypothetical protein